VVLARADSARAIFYELAKVLPGNNGRGSGEAAPNAAGAFHEQEMSQAGN
jgi:hypothetical protein